MKLTDVLELLTTGVVFTSAFIFYGLLVYAMFYLLHYLGVAIAVVGLVFAVSFILLADYKDKKNYGGF